LSLKGEGIYCALNVIAVVMLSLIGIWQRVGDLIRKGCVQKKTQSIKIQAFPIDYSV
jgi:hypothetical protein